MQIANKPYKKFLRESQRDRHSIILLPHCNLSTLMLNNRLLCNGLDFLQRLFVIDRHDLDEKR